MNELEGHAPLRRERCNCPEALYGQRHAFATARRLRAGTRYGLLTLLPVVLLTVSSTPSVALNPESICFAGSGKPKTDIVMCTMALLPAAPLSRATLLTRRARARIQIKDDAQALEDLAQALAINPLSAEALIEKARALRFLGRPAAARETLDKALRLSPNDSRARRTRAVLALTRADYGGAILDLTAVIAADYGKGESHALRGIAHYFAGAPAASLKDFREAAAHDSAYDYLPLWIALAQYRTGGSGEDGLQQARAELLGDEDWPAPVIAMYQAPGPAALAAALDLARQGTPSLRRARTGQIHFLHGELLRFREAPDQAKAAFEAAVRDGDPRTVEYALAAHRLAAQSPPVKDKKN